MRITTRLVLAATLAPAVHAQAVIETLGGTGVCGLGDLDGDGFGDFAVADDVAQRPGGVGAVSIVSSATGAVLAVVDPTGTPAYFGERLANAGDVNGDGRDDLLVADMRSSVPRRVWAIDSTTGATIHSWSGPGFQGSFEHNFGFAVSAAGDIDLDGFGDVAIGLPGNQGGVRGEVHFYSGALGGLIRVVQGSAVHVYGGADEFGYAIAPVGDVDGDGVPDVAVGAPARWDLAACGFDVISGADGSRVLAWRPGAICYATGNSVGGLGDVDGDGTPDVWVFDRDQSANAESRVLAISGATGAELFRFIPSPESTASTGLDVANFGIEVTSVGDVDGDGRPDVAVLWVDDLFPGAGPPSQSRATVYRGANGARLFDIAGPAGSPSVRGLAAVGDVDGDGFAEVGAAHAPSYTLFGAANIAGALLVERTPENGRSICLGLPNSTGVGAVLRASSATGFEAAANDLQLAATRLPASTFGLFSVSQGDTIVFHPGGSEGRLCIGAPVSGRFAVVAANAEGQLVMSPDLTSIPSFSAAGATTVAAQAGDTFNFQLWYRDQGPSGTTSNFSGAVGITFH